MYERILQSTDQLLNSIENQLKTDATQVESRGKQKTERKREGEIKTVE